MCILFALLKVVSDYDWSVVAGMLCMCSCETQVSVAGMLCSVFL